MENTITTLLLWDRADFWFLIEADGTPVKQFPLVPVVNLSTEPAGFTFTHAPVQTDSVSLQSVIEAEISLHRKISAVYAEGISKGSVL